MLGRLYDSQECSAARALELVGERWSLLILRDSLFRGYTRFAEFERSLGLASNVLSRRLEDFVAAGLMERGRDDRDRRSRTYRLTEKGLALKPVVMALTEWGDRWVRPGPIDFIDERSGAPVRLEPRTTDKGEPIPLDRIAVRRRGVGERPASRS